jgi:5-oxoprolinase (ATP-hydrolysing) subunit A
MAKAVREALAAGVAIGAHPSYPDREHFGRLPMPRSPEEVYADVSEQVAALGDIARRYGGELHHVKPHGALYNRAARDEATADAVARAIRDVDARLALYGLAGSSSIACARAIGIRAVEEAFADRAYTRFGDLFPRTISGATIDDEARAERQVLSIVLEGTVESIDGVRVPVRAGTICIHGDGPNALGLARRTRAALLRAGVTISLQR